MIKNNISENHNKTWKTNFGFIFFIFCLVVWFLLFIMGLRGYSGSKLAYTLFSILTGIMLISGFGKNISYGYTFLSIFLWLGFWVKLTVHTILDYPFVEPVGSFVGTPQAWDEVLYIAIVASLGIFLGKLIYAKFIYILLSGEYREESVVPFWYVKKRKCWWGGLSLIAVVVFIINYKYGIHHIGLVPRTVLMWPLNAIISWLLNIGLATSVAVMIWWDISLRKNISISIYAIIIESLISSVSILSRAAYVFHALPQLWAVHRFKHKFKDWSLVKTLVLIFIFGLFLVLSISAVTTFRNILYQSGVYQSTSLQVASSRLESLRSEIDSIKVNIKKASQLEREVFELKLSKLITKKNELESIVIQEKEKNIATIKSGSLQSKVLLNEFSYQITGGVAPVILQLSIDRWIGLEGLMAVQAYPEKNEHLLWQALKEKPEAGKPDLYQKITNSIYLKSDGTKFLFATLPGAAAFLYYSGSLLIVLIGMLIFSLVILIVERIIYTLTSNPILCSLYGAVIAGSIAQFGGSPRLSLPYFFMLACGILLVWIVQSKFFTQILFMLNFVSTTKKNDD